MCTVVVNQVMVWILSFKLLTTVKIHVMQFWTFRWWTIILRFSLYSSIGTCCRSLFLPFRAASLAPKKIVEAMGGVPDPYKRCSIAEITNPYNICRKNWRTYRKEEMYHNKETVKSECNNRHGSFSVHCSIVPTKDLGF